MNPVSEPVKAFFKDFDQANTTFDANLLATQLSDPVVGADPKGSIQVISQENFLAGIGERQAYLATIGFQFVKTVPLEEIPLGPNYTLVKTHGIMRLEETPGQYVDLVHDSAYVLFVKDDSVKYVFTLSHEDPKKMAQELGSFSENR